MPGGGEESRKAVEVILVSDGEVLGWLVPVGGRYEEQHFSRRGRVGRMWVAAQKAGKEYCSGGGSVVSCVKRVSNSDKSVKDKGRRGW
jgi:hypothetical protein